MSYLMILLTSVVHLNLTCVLHSVNTYWIIMVHYLFCLMLGITSYLENINFLSNFILYGLNNFRLSGARSLSTVLVVVLTNWIIFYSNNIKILNVWVYNIFTYVYLHLWTWTSCQLDNMFALDCAFWTHNLLKVYC